MYEKSAALCYRSVAIVENCKKARNFRESFHQKMKNYFCPRIEDIFLLMFDFYFIARELLLNIFLLSEPML